MCTKDGIIDEGCKQCSKPEPKHNFCSDEVPSTVPKCEDIFIDGGFQRDAYSNIYNPQWEGYKKQRLNKKK